MGEEENGHSLMDILGVTFVSNLASTSGICITPRKINNVCSCVLLAMLVYTTHKYDESIE